MKRLLALLLTVCMFPPTSLFAADTPQTVFEQRVRTIADTLVNTYGATSVQYALIDNGAIRLSGSSGVYSKTENRAITKDNLYGIGSVSKVYTAAAVMVLVDKGLVDIDQPLTAYIPEFKMADERYKQITPRMLLNHSSGIYGTHFANAFLLDDNDTAAHDTLLSQLAEQGLRNTPGEFSEYCNDGFTLLEILVERVSKVSFTEFIAKQFSQPLGLQNTKTPLDDFDKSQIVKVHMPMFENNLPNDTVNIFGTGGLYASAEDMCQFAEVVMGKRPDILSTESALLMQQPEYKKGMWVDDGGENFFGYGLGWDSVAGYPFNDAGIQVLVKGGDTILFHSILVAIPEYDIAMAVSTSGGISLFNYAFATTVLQELLLEKGIIDQISPIQTFEPPVQATMPKALEKYSGTYANANAQATLLVKDDAITVPALLGGMVPEQKYIYTSDGTFKSADGSVSLTFSEQPDGNTYLQLKLFLTLPGVGQIVWTYFDMQKIEPVTVPPNVAEAWSKRAGKKYFLVSEKPTSQVYLWGTSMTELKLNSDFSNGFAYGGTQIVSENHAVNTLKFRDITDLTFFTNDGQEYLKAKSFVFINGESIQDITDGATCTIQADGFAKYYKVGEGAQGKDMHVNMPEGAAYAVYDANGICVNFTTVSKNTTTTLPANGKIVFIGNPGDTFEITIDK